MTTTPAQPGSSGSSQDTLGGARFSESELNNLAELGADAKQSGSVAAFREAIELVDSRAWYEGKDKAVSAETKRQTNMRSVALLLVVLAVVSMPVIAMFKEIDPDSFGTFIAPITGIAGTVVGFWFSSIDKKS